MKNEEKSWKSSNIRFGTDFLDSKIGLFCCFKVEKNENNDETSWTSSNIRFGIDYMDSKIKLFWIF